MFVLGCRASVRAAAALALCVLGVRGSAEPVAAFGETDGIFVPGIAGVAADTTVWFRVTKEGRTLASGSAAVAAGKSLRLPVSLPELKPGVVLPFELTLRRDAEAGEPLFDGHLWVFSRQPVAPGHNPVAPRTLRLYDPEGRTDAAFQELDLAFESVPRLDLVTELRDSVLVVGEGLSLEAERGLLDTMVEAVRNGNEVLLLAPVEGTLRLPAWHRLVAGTLNDVFPRPQPPAGARAPNPALLVPRESGTLFRLVGLRDDVGFEVVREDGAQAVGWDDALSGGRFRACGLPIVEHWKTSPAARWLLVELLDHFTKKGTLP